MEADTLRGYDRVRDHSPAHVNTRIDRRTEESLEQTLRAGSRAIATRLAELDKEWNVDRALMLTFSALGNIVHELEVRHDRRWGWLLRVQMAFMGIHAAVGWCPPIAVLRRLGFRTQQEIDAERALLLRAIEARR